MFLSQDTFYLQKRDNFRVSDQVSGTVMMRVILYEVFYFAFFLLSASFYGLDRMGK
jgi:hypothetical protein